MFLKIIWKLYVNKIDLPSVKKKDAIPKLHSSNGLMLSW